MPLPILHLDESKSAAPEISPGIVEDEEQLIREMFNPQHINEEGKVIERAISVNELLVDGFSVHRIQHVSKEFVEKSIQTRLSRKRKEPWASEGVPKLKTLAVRQIFLEDERAFVVIDTATEDNPGHASIYFATPQKGKAYAREARGILLPLLQDRVTLDEAYDGVIG